MCSAPASTSTRWITTWCTFTASGQRSAPLQSARSATAFNPSQSKRGSSSHNHNPFVALKAHGATEENGEVYGVNLIYSGNFSIEAEVDCLNATRLLAGINPTDFTWRLEPNESFTAPEAVMVYTDKGLGEMSRIFHRTYMKHLIKSPWQRCGTPRAHQQLGGRIFRF